MEETVNWTGLYLEDPGLVPQKICALLNIDCAAAGFGGEDWQVSMSDSAFVLCIRSLVIHFVNFGFTNAEITDAIQLANECYTQLISPGSQTGVVSDVELFIDAIRKYALNFSPTKLTQLVDYLQKDLIQHGNLYRFCATSNRQNGARSYSLQIDTPPDKESFLPLKKGLKKDICEYEMKINQIETVEQQDKARLMDELVAKEAEVEKAAKQAITEKLEELMSTEFQQQHRNILEIINAVVKQHASILNTRVESAVENMELDLRYKLDKTVLPRPAKLGPPPRYKLKPTIQVSKLDPLFATAANVQRAVSVQSSKASSGKRK